LQLNEGRAMLGYDPLPDGDVFKQPAAPVVTNGGGNDGQPTATP